MKQVLKERKDKQSQGPVYLQLKELSKVRLFVNKTLTTVSSC